jgi:hypothetical protein
MNVFEEAGLMVTYGTNHKKEHNSTNEISESPYFYNKRFLLSSLLLHSGQKVLPK